MLRVQLYRTLLGLLGRLPLPLLRAVGGLAGLVPWLVRSRMYLVTDENLRTCLPELTHAEHARLTRKALQEIGKTAMETAFAWTAPVARCRAAISEVDGKDHVDAALSRGRGFIFIIPHLGNWEMINHYLGEHYDLTHMYQRARTRPLNILIQSWRSRTGTRFVETDRGGIKQQLRALHAGECIGAMPDQEPDVHTGVFADFFGVPCLTTTLIPNIAIKTGAGAAIAYCRRLEKGGGFKVVFEPVEFDRTPTDGDVAGARQLNDAIERAVVRVPEQYLWSYKRFRTRPAGEPERYVFRQHPLRVAMDGFAIGLFLRAGNALQLRTLRRLGKHVGKICRLTGNRYQKTTRTNLTLCASKLIPMDIRRIEKDSLTELGKTLMETGVMWRADQERIDRLCLSIEGMEHLPDPATPGPLIVLTPPLGNRELVMRILGERYRVTEYYYPNSNTAVDDAIRKQRNAMGIALVPHTNDGIATLRTRLEAREVVTLCPDQQPRLRMGEFVPFFGTLALTTVALSRLVRATDASVVFGVAIREENGFRVHFEPCQVDAAAGDYCILHAVNRQLETIVGAWPEQYRWSDKRFNIRPAGERKVYRSWKKGAW